MSQPTSAGLGWVQAASSWFRKDYDVIGRMFIVAAFVRAALALHTTVMNLAFDRTAIIDMQGMIITFAIMIAWTLLVTSVLRRPKSRTVWVHFADTAVTAAIIIVTPQIVSAPYGETSLAGYWMLGCSLYAAVLTGTGAGIASAVVTSLALLAVPPRWALARVDLTLGALLITICVGALITQFKHTITEQERARIRAVALGERERLARIVHDGALQVLALVEREAPALGPKGERLSALARESEDQLRALIRDQSVADQGATTQVDLATALARFQSSKVTVSTTAGKVMVPRLIVEEVSLTVAEVLKNVKKHAGPEAKAWVLLDQEDATEAILWIRDDGVGMELKRVADAASHGRLGIKNSIVGRMSALGGSAELNTAPGQGTEWELRFPVRLRR